MKTIGLFIPCYIDQFYPQAGIATLELLEKLGWKVEYPLQQTCCGQPMANSGCEDDGLGAARLFIENFIGYDYIVAPSGSCVLHVKEHFNIPDRAPAVEQVQNKIYELCEFLTDVAGVEQLDARFPYRVGLHQSCHGHRGLRLGQSSERVGPPFSKMRYLLSLVEGLELTPLDRPDECCGFGGTFAVFQEAVSVKMGNDRIADHQRHGAEVITAGDMSCLMHLEGLIRRRRLPLQVRHIAEILNAK